MQLPCSNRRVKDKGMRYNAEDDTLDRGIAGNSRSHAISLDDVRREGSPAQSLRRRHDL
jgi:hypothetical protein